MNETTVPAPTAAPPKITLAALVRKGCEGTFQAIGHRAYDLAGQTYVCASGAAALAAGMIQPTRGPSPEADGSIHYSDVPVRERTDLHFIVDDMLLAPAPPPPASCDHPLVGADADIEGLMIHLNDGHRWPRERIAAYLEEWER